MYLIFCSFQPADKTRRNILASTYKPSCKQYHIPCTVFSTQESLTLRGRNCEDEPPPGREWWRWRRPLLSRPAVSAWCRYWSRSGGRRRRPRATPPAPHQHMVREDSRVRRQGRMATTKLSKQIYYLIYLLWHMIMQMQKYMLCICTGITNRNGWQQI